MAEEDCQYFCCGECKGLFKDATSLVGHQENCDGRVENAHCHLVACEKTKYLSYVKLSQLAAVRKVFQNLCNQVKNEPFVEHSYGRTCEKNQRRDNVSPAVFTVPERDDSSDEELSRRKEASGRPMSARSLKPIDIVPLLSDSADAASDFDTEFTEAVVMKTMHSADDTNLESTVDNLLEETLLASENTDMVTVMPQVANDRAVTDSMCEKKSEVKKTKASQSQQVITVDRFTVDNPRVSSRLQQKRLLRGNSRTPGLPRKRIKKTKEESQPQATCTSKQTHGTLMDNFDKERVTDVLKCNNGVTFGVDTPTLEESEVNEQVGSSTREVAPVQSVDNLDQNLECNDQESLQRSESPVKNSHQRTRSVNDCHSKLLKEEDHAERGRTVQDKIMKEKLPKAKKSYPDYPFEERDLPDGTKIRIFKCNVSNCKFETKHIGFYNKHLKESHNNGNLWKCNQCEFETPNKGKLKLHLNQHGKPYMCEFCSYRCATKADLERHVWRHTGNFPIKCPECDYRCRQRKALNEHMRKHTGQALSCDVEGCNFTTFYAFALKNHKSAKHTPKGKFACQVCSYVTNDRGSFSKHTKIHMGMKDYKCSKCNYKSVTKHDIVKHMRSHTGEKVYFCDRCEFSTSYSSAMRLHMMTHFGIKPWQCSLCGYNSNTKQKVDRHLTLKHPSSQGHVINLGLKLDMNMKDFKQGSANGEAAIPMVYQVEEVAVTAPAEMDEQNVTEVIVEEYLEEDREEIAGLASLTDLAAGGIATAEQIQALANQMVVSLAQPLIM